MNLAEITSMGKWDAERAMLDLRGEPNTFRNVRGPFEWREPTP